MKATLHIPTEQYGFVEIELEAQNGPEAIDKYYELSNYATSGEGLSDDEFGAFIQRQLAGEPNHVRDYERMSKEQQKYVQINKRAINRINYKVNKEEKSLK